LTTINIAPPLYNCVRDADQLIEVLTEKYQFEASNVTKLYNAEATEDRILDALNQLIDNVQEQDNLVILYSGHGEYENTIDEGYWIPVDGQLNQSADYISNSRITKYLRAIKAHHILLVVDSCFSGALFTTRKLTDRTPTNRLDHIASRWLLTSGRNEVVADGTPGDHSPFADNLLYFLKNNKDTSLSISELAHHVIEGVTYNANQTPRGEPLQNVGHKGGQFYFHLKGVDRSSPRQITQPHQKINIDAPPGKKENTVLPKVLSAAVVLLVAIGGFFLIPGQQKKEENLIKPSTEVLIYDSLMQEANQLLQQTNPNVTSLKAAEQTYEKALVIANKTTGIEPQKAKESLLLVRLRLEELTSTEDQPLPTPAKPEPTISKEKEIWRITQQKGSEQAYREYLKRYPKGEYIRQAERAIAQKYNYKIDLTTSFNSGDNILVINTFGGKPPFHTLLNYEGQTITNTSSSREIKIDLSSLKIQAGKRIGSVIVKDRNYVSKGLKTFVY
jgi:hypothetical protein